MADKDLQAQMVKMMALMQESMKAQAESIKAQTEKHDKAMEVLAKRLASEDASGSSVSPAKLMSEIGGRISTFVFDLEGEKTFPKWFARYGTVITVEGKALSDVQKVSLLVGKLSDETYEQYTRRICPKECKDIKFEDTVSILKEMFDVKKSLFSHRFACINITREGETPVEYTNKVNALCEAAALDKIDVDGWKVFFWLRGLDPITDQKQLAYFLKHVEQKMEKAEAVKINDLCAEWQKYQRQNSVLLEMSEGDKAVRAVRAKKFGNQKSQKPSNREESRGDQCWNCGRSGHKKPECSQALTKCFNCQREGHLAKFCRSNGSSRSKRTQNVKVVGGTAAEDVLVNSVRQYVTANVEGKSIDFQLDTGSDITLISRKDWERIGEPKLEKYSDKIRSASGNEVKLLGRVLVSFELKGSVGSEYVYVREHGNLLGLDWIEKSSEMSYHMGRMVNALSQTCTSPIRSELEKEKKRKGPTVFKEELGRCTKEKAVLTVKKEASPVCMAEVQRETKKDKLLQEVIKLVSKGTWSRKVDERLKQFNSVKDSLSVVQGCLKLGDRVVVPKSLQRAVLKQLHEGHPGMVRMKQLARAFVYWPRLEEEVEKVVAGCNTCKVHRKTSRKVPLVPGKTPERVWQRVHVEYVGPDNGQYYLVAVDAKSKWAEVKIVRSTSATSTVRTLKEIFGQNGFPETIVADNGTQFISKEFAEMCRDSGIEHIRAPAFHLQSNGQAERVVDTLKRGLQKLKGEGSVSNETLAKFLLHYRSTPSNALSGLSPAEIYLHRRIRTDTSSRIPRLKEKRAEMNKKSIEESREHVWMSTMFDIFELPSATNTNPVVTDTSLQNELSPSSSITNVPSVVPRSDDFVVVEKMNNKQKEEEPDSQVVPTTEANNQSGKVQSSQGTNPLVTITGTQSGVQPVMSSQGTQPGVLPGISSQGASRETSQGHGSGKGQRSATVPIPVRRSTRIPEGSCQVRSEHHLTDLHQFL